MYNVDRYLADFLASLEAQTFGLDDVEVILVDDGSTDGSHATLEAWAASRPTTVRVVTQENAGQGAARNAGLALATGEWVTFPDPDDTLDPGYLAAVDGYLRAHPDSVLAGTYRILHLESTDEFSDTHPLRKHFRATDREVDLDLVDHMFYGSAPCAFFSRELLVAQGRRFDVQIRPNFEDGHFISRYLLDAPSRKTGFVTSARYYYRKRGDQSSTLQNSLGDPRRYTVVPRRGYLDALQRATELQGSAPAWLQAFILYELSWYFSAETRASGSATAAHGDVAREFLEALREIRAHLDDAAIRTFSARPLDSKSRDALLFLGQVQAHTGYAVIRQVDPEQRLVQISYRYAGTAPTEEFRIAGAPVDPVHAKRRTLIFFDAPLLWERIVWLPLRAGLTVRLGGDVVELRDAEQSPTSFRTGPSRMGPRPAPRPRSLPWADRILEKLARSRPVRKVFGNAWVLVDRLHDADDSAELLFRHLRAHKRKINAWFVIEKGTPDWERLRRDGYRRVIPLGSLQWKLLMLNAQHLISSHADAPVVNPPALARFEKTWRFTFLQHGVIKDDISAWLNPKPIDLFITSTPAETEFVAGDGSPFRYTTREVAMTELPRFDRLHAAGQAVSEAQQDLILIAPTWRSWLVPPLAKGSQRRELVEDVLSSEYVQEWSALLRSPELRATAQREGLRIAFMPHPNVTQLMDQLDLPDDVETVTYVGTDIARTFARAAVLVTDYSSVAFNAAYMDRPVVYFQFDGERVAEGAHVGRAGYFSYERDGFGPVTTTLTDTEAAIDTVTSAGRRATGVYQERVAATFPLRDGKACKRVTQRVLALGRKQGGALQPK